MKAIVLKPGTQELRLANWPEPVIQKACEVKVKVLRVGICGTDREEAVGGRSEAPPGEKELTLGHEMVGQVTETGRSVTKVKTGDYVVVTVRRGCNPGLEEKLKNKRSRNGYVTLNVTKGS